MQKFLLGTLSAALVLGMIAPAFAEDGSSSSASSSSAMSSSSSSSMKDKMKDKMMEMKKKMNDAKTVDGACMSAAVDKRDTAIMAGLTAFTASVTTSLQTRKDALKAAWLLTDKAAREKALKAAWDAFRGTWKTNRQTMNTAKKNAWKQFRTDAKTCKAPTADAGGEAMDAGL